MIQIAPQEKFPIIYQLEDPSDSGTYYVQAIVRNSVNGQTIKTINLTQGTGGRFAGVWEALEPEDTYVDITVKVYTDSAHTVLSTKYGVDQDLFVVRTPWAIKWLPAMSNAGVDYEKVKEIITVALQGIAVDYPDIDFEPIHKKLDSLADSVQILPQSIEIPKNEPVDFTPILSSLDRVHASVKKLPTAKDITPYDDSAVKDILTRHSEDLKQIRGHHTAYEKTLGDFHQSFKTALKEHGEKVKDSIADGSITFTLNSKGVDKAGDKRTRITHNLLTA